MLTIYNKLAEHEADETIAHVFRQMSGIEKGHAEAFAKKGNLDLRDLMLPSWRAKVIVVFSVSSQRSGLVFDWAIYLLVHGKKCLVPRVKASTLWAICCRHNFWQWEINRQLDNWLKIKSA
jgi:hypothetical protein